MTKSRYTENRYAVCIGINTYAPNSGLGALHYAEDDARDVDALLADLGFPDSHRKLLLGSDATLSAINAALDEFILDKPHENDLVLFYFAGHSMPLRLSDTKNNANDESAKGEVFLGSYDFDANQIRQSTSFRLQRALGMKRLRETFFEGEGSLKRLFLLDSCYSGDFFGPRYRDDIDPVQEHIQRVLNSKSTGRVALSSCLPFQKAREDATLGHGLFTYHLLNALSGKDRDALNQYGWLTVGSLFEYLAEKLPEGQRPVLSGVQQDIFQLADYSQHAHNVEPKQGDEDQLPRRNADDNKHPLLRENFDHLIVTHTQLFAGREDIISSIHKYIGENLNGYIFIEGLSGYGKTSLLAKIVQNHPEFAYHFISQAYRTYGSDFNPTELEWLMQNLCEQLEQDSSKDFNSLKLRARFHRLLGTPSLNEAKVIILDGVDEIDRHPNYLFGLLPPQLPSGVFIIFSARKLGGRNYLAEIGLTSRNIQLHIDLPGLDTSAIQQLLDQAGGEATQYSNNESFIQGLYSVSEGDPFYLRFLIEDVATGMVRPDNLASVPSGLEDYLDKQFSILARSAYLPQHRTLLGLVINAFGPLSKDELITMVSGLDGINFDNVIRDIHRFLLEYNNIFTLCHRRFKEYFYKKNKWKRGT